VVIRERDGTHWPGFTNERLGKRPEGGPNGKNSLGGGPGNCYRGVGRLGTGRKGDRGGEGWRMKREVGKVTSSDQRPPGPKKETGKRQKC